MVAALIVNGILALWVLVDAGKRKASAGGWFFGTLILGVLLIPFYRAGRPLKAGEKRYGGYGWNVMKGFALFWTLFMFVAAVTGMFNAGSAINEMGAASDAERAGAGLGVALGMGMLFCLWFFPLVGALVLGLLLKKGNEVEEGPTGRLAQIDQTKPV